jgi:hypothetical protein
VLGAAAAVNVAVDVAAGALAAGWSGMLGLGLGLGLGLLGCWLLGLGMLAATVSWQQVAPASSL